MKGVKVDPETRTARAEAGVTMGDLDSETQAFGLATPMGVVSETGIAGLTLGGGMGWLRRKHGLSSDNLLSVDVVTADGRFVRRARPRTPTFLGHARRRGQLRRRDLLRVPAPPGGPEVMFGFVFYPGIGRRRCCVL